jgi:predicted PurR-regulated permease PerM
METNDKVFRFTIRLVLAMLIVYILIIGQSFLTPLAWAIVIALASVQFVDKARQKSGMPAGLVILLFILTIVTVIFLIFYFFYIELSHIIGDLPEINEKLSAGLHSLSVSLQGSGIHIPDHIDKDAIREWADGHSDTIFGFVSAFATRLEHLVLGAFYLFFLLYYKDLMPRFFENKIKNEKQREKLQENINKSVSIIKNYLVGLLILALITSVLVYIILLIFGVDYALFFAALLGVLSLIPFIGNPLGLIIIGVFTLLTKDAISTTIFVLVFIWIANLIHENVIRPWLMGDRLQINAFVVFISVIIGGLLWGISGMILFIPLAGIIKVALMFSEETTHYAILLSEKPKKEKKKRLKKKK